MSHDAGPAADWARYWRSPDEPLEAMHAHFRGQVYHRHSHDCYSFGVTESGAQGFTCRRAGHVSTVGMVMAFNPEDPHDGHAATGPGFTYRMIHVGPEFLTDLLADITGRPAAAAAATAGFADQAHLTRWFRRCYGITPGAYRGAASG